MSASSKTGWDPRSDPQAMGMSFPSGTADPIMEEPQFLYVFVKISHDHTIVPTLAAHLRGIFLKLEHAVNTAWNRIYRTNPPNSWEVPLRDIAVKTKELFLTVVGTDGCITTVYVQWPPLEEELMFLVDADWCTLWAYFRTCVLSLLWILLFNVCMHCQKLASKILPSCGGYHFGYSIVPCCVGNNITHLMRYWRTEIPTRCFSVVDHVLEPTSWYYSKSNSIACITHSGLVNRFLLSVLLRFPHSVLVTILK